ncbi:MAG: hypothetical protein MRY83_12920 [Flavobacteriales bacterium]|nr:hypothetical protein [Flavobacteriales bacterium]
MRLILTFFISSFITHIYAQNIGFATPIIETETQGIITNQDLDLGINIKFILSDSVLNYDTEALTYSIVTLINKEVVSIDVQGELQPGSQILEQLKAVENGRKIYFEKIVYDKYKLPVVILEKR